MSTDLVNVTISKLVHGGQGLAELPDGKKVFVWNALPGESVEIRIIKNKRSYSEAIAERIHNPSPERVEAQEQNYLATSPWQIMNFEFENNMKRQIVLDVLEQESVAIPSVSPTVSGSEPWHYRNKMEYSFWGDDDGLHLALHMRGSHGKQIITGSKLALPAIDTAAEQIRAKLESMSIRAGDLKTVVIRCSQQGAVVAALYVKTAAFPKIELPKAVQGITVYYSNPKSPASVATELLQQTGDSIITDTIDNTPLQYNAESFFQVTIPIFEQALKHIKGWLDAPAITDMYAGVGSIGLCVASKAVTLVELDVATSAMAAVNAEKSSLQTEVIETSAERSLEYITADKPVIVDPPRAGLHPKVVDQLLQTGPEQVVYLSCNPITQARDLALLQGKYQVEQLEVFNFFPRTPHIESLALLRRR